MKKLLTFLTLLTLFFTTAWATETTVNASKVTSQSFTWTGSGGETWSGTVVAGATNQSFYSTGYAQIGSSGSPASSVTLSTSDIPGTITSIVIDCAAYQGKATVSATVGGNAFGTQNQSVPRWSNNEGGEVTFTGSASGAIAITMTNGSGGRAMYIKSVTVTYSTGSTPTCAMPTITITPASGPYYVGETSVSATIACSDPTDATILYRFNNTGDWNTYSSAVEIPNNAAGTVTIQAKATKSGYNDSGSANESVTFENPPAEPSTVAEIVALEKNTNFTFKGSLVVSGQATYNNHKYLYAQDATGGMLFFDANEDYVFGDLIPSGFTGTKTTYNGAPEVTNIDMAPATTHNQPLEAEELNPDGIVAEQTGYNVFEYSVIKNATITLESGKYYINVGDDKVQIYDRFGHAVPSDYADKEYDVYGVSGWYNGAQFMPLEFVDHVTPTHNITYGTLTNGAFNTDENPEEAAEGSTVTIKTIPTAGYKLDQLTVTPSDNNVSVPTVTIDGNNATFTMPECDVTVNASFKLADNPIIVNIVPSNSGGNIWIYSGTEIEGVKYAKMGDDIYFRVVTDQLNSILFESLTIKDADGNTIDFEDDGNDGWAWEEGYYGRKFKFVMPATAVTLTAQYDMNRGTLCLAGHFDGNSSWRTSGPEFTYDSNSDTYTIDAYFTGIDDNGGNDYFFLTLDGDEKHPGGDGNYYIYDLNGGAMSFNLGGSGNNNFGCAPGVYHIEINGTLTSMKFTKQSGFIFEPPTGSTVSPGQTVTATSNAATKIAEIKTTDTGAQGDVATQLSLNNSDWYENVTLENVGNNIPVYAKMYLSNIYDDAQATYNVATENNSKQYKLSTTLTPGKKYIIVSEGKTDVMGAYVSESSRFTSASASGYEADWENNIVTLNSGSDVTILTLGGSDGAWTLQNNNNYLTWISGNSLVVEEIVEETATTDANKWTIEFDEYDNAVISNKGTSERQIMRNNGSPIFACYTGTQTKVQLYQQTEEVVIPTVATPVITPGTGTYTSAQTVQITCTTPEAKIWYKYGDMADYDEYTEALTISENTTLTAYATKDGYTDSDPVSATYTFAEIGTEEFELVTSASQLVEGNEYIIVAATYTTAMGEILSRYGTEATGYQFNTTGDYSKLTLNNPTDVNVFTLGKTNGANGFQWTFKDKDGKYLYADQTGGGIDVQAYTNDYLNEFKIVIGSGSNYNNYATLQVGGNYQILYSPGTGFRNWDCDNATQQPNNYKYVLLYTKATTPVEEPTETTLANLCENGEKGKLYTISNENGLLGVYKHGTSVWFKDENGESIDKQTPGDDDKFYVVEEGNNAISEKDFDQSNWIEVVFPEDREEINYVSAYVKNLTGRLEDKINPKLILTVPVDDDNDVTYLTYPEDEYTPNPYMAANFLGSQEYTNSQGITSTYFFPMPKAQEYAKILWAVWDGENMNMPGVNNGNVYGFQGSFTLNDEYCSLNLTIGNSYDFEGIIRKVTSSKAAGDNYEVSPIRISDTPTAISTVSVNGNVKSVKYVNVAGMISDTPFQGVNIVVTEYTDGSRTTTKMLKR